MRHCRKRRRNGLQRVAIELHLSDIEGLVHREFLKEDQRDDLEMLQAVVLGLVYDPAEGRLVRQRR